MYKETVSDTILTVTEEEKKMNNIDSYHHGQMNSGPVSDVPVPCIEIELISETSVSSSQPQ